MALRRQVAAGAAPRGHRGEPTASPPNATTPGSCAPSTSTRGPGESGPRRSTSEWRARRAPRRSPPLSPCSSAGARARDPTPTGAAPAVGPRPGLAGARGPAKAAGGVPRAPLVSGASAIHGEMPDSSGAAFGVFGVSHSAQGAGLVGRNETAGADLVLDGAAQGEADTLFTQAGIDRPSGSPQTFDVQNSGAGAMRFAPGRRRRGRHGHHGDRLDAVGQRPAGLRRRHRRRQRRRHHRRQCRQRPFRRRQFRCRHPRGQLRRQRSGGDGLTQRPQPLRANLDRKYSGRPVRAEPAQRRPRAQWPRDGDRWREHWRRGQEQLDQWPSALRPRSLRTAATPVASWDNPSRRQAWASAARSTRPPVSTGASTAGPPRRPAGASKGRPRRPPAPPTESGD